MNFDQAARKLGIGGVAVNPHVGGTSVASYRVGAPAQMTPNFNQPAIDYSEQQFSEGGNGVFGLGRTLISAGETLTVQRTPMRPFNAQELRCPSTTVGLYIVNLEIQGVKFFANKNDGGAPIELFSEVSRIRSFFGLATIQTDTGVEFVVSNPTDEDLYFSGLLFGTFVRI